MPCAGDEETGRVTKRRIHKCPDCGTLILLRKHRCVECAETRRAKGERDRKKRKKESHGSEQVHEGPRGSEDQG